MYYGHHDHMGGAWWAISIIVVVLAVALVVVLWRLRSEGGAAPDPGKGHDPRSAREILDRRLATGEIDEEQYRGLRSALEHPPPPAEPVQEPAAP